MARVNDQSEGMEERYRALIELIRGTPDVSVGSPGKKGFGSDALQVGGKIFAILSRGQLVLKLPRRRVDELVAAGEGERFDAGRGRPMKEWVCLGTGSGEAWLPLAREALEFVSGRS